MSSLLLVYYFGLLIGMSIKFASSIAFDLKTCFQVLDLYTCHNCPVPVLGILTKIWIPGSCFHGQTLLVSSFLCDVVSIVSSFWVVRYWYGLTNVLNPEG